MLTIFQGDDTAANRRSITMTLPDDDIGEGFSIGFSMLGLERVGAYKPGGLLRFNYTREETAAFPLGVTYGEVYLMKNGLKETICNTIPVRVTDSVIEASKGGESGGGNGINLNIVINTGVPRVDKAELTKASSVADIKSLANALLDAINGSSE